VDYEAAAFAWEKADLPAPTIICVNPENSHAHLLYELINPVSFLGRDGGAPRIKPMKFYDAIYRSMRKKLNADVGYIRLMVKNPLHKQWYTIFHDHAVYDLAQLAESAPPIWYEDGYFETKKELEANGDIIFEGQIEKGIRFKTLYSIMKHYCYRAVRHALSADGLINTVLEFGNAVNLERCIPPLRSSEIRSIARNVGRWTWQHRETVIRNTKNRGAMNFDPVPYPISPQDKENIVKERQRLGADYTNKIQRTEAEFKIIHAIGVLVEKGERVTMGRVSRMTEISKSNISAHYRYLFEVNHNDA
jgi:hypothetical protein